MARTKNFTVDGRMTAAGRKRFIKLLTLKLDSRSRDKIVPLVDLAAVNVFMGIYKTSGILG